MNDLPIGVYEELITESLRAALEAHDGSTSIANASKLQNAEAPDRIALHLSAALRRVLESLPEDRRAAVALAVSRRVTEDAVAAINERVGKKYQQDVRDLALAESETPVLTSVVTQLPDGSPATIARPIVPLLDTTLLSNARGEPALSSSIASEIASADQVDILMAFVRLSGIRPLLSALREHARRNVGRSTIRVLTTTYTNSTELRALEALAHLGADVRVSYDTTTTRLHAKAWLFDRESGFSTGYVGSSNLTHSAQVTGLEWNVRVSARRNPDAYAKMRATFDAYWESEDFVPFKPAEFVERTAQQGRGDDEVVAPISVRPFPFQERLLEQVALQRARGHRKNLLVSATGTGKTVMAALDYKRLYGATRGKLLFIAHRKEILVRARSTFRVALQDGSFGELWVDGQRPTQFRHVFASIQSLHENALSGLKADHFDMVIMDEVHHSAAESYLRVLGHFEPEQLLGLTATPERGDGQSILEHFDGTIAAELRLWDAIDEQRLAPFQYFGIADEVDLRDVPWRRGRGYDVDALSNVLTADGAYAKRVLKELRARVGSLRDSRCLGFCVSVAHARFMAEIFRGHGVRAEAVSGDTDREARDAAQRALLAGDLDVLFCVDLFNEGVDLPAVDTLLFLRPTQSATLFIQQLGRGLRKSDGKESCLVLDFVGQHRREFRFDRPLRALLGGTRRDIEQQVQRGFPFLPAGCHMELDSVARERVLTSLKNAIPSNWGKHRTLLREMAAARGGDVTLAAYLDEAGIEPEELYQDGKRCWSDLRDEVGLATRNAGPEETSFRNAIGRLLHTDDDERLDFFSTLLEVGPGLAAVDMDERERRMARMLIEPLREQALKPKDSPYGSSLDDGLRLLHAHPQVVAELRELLPILRQRIDHLHAPLSEQPDVPLQIHARYSRIEALAAFHRSDSEKSITSWREGVKKVEDARSDVFVFTLDKSSGDFSPTTRYRDYALSPELIHWESQSGTSPDSPTGQRYQHHEERNWHIHLFARLRQDERAFWYLGPATYVRHTGAKPMAITWRLKHRLPGDLYQTLKAAA